MTIRTSLGAGAAAAAALALGLAAPAQASTATVVVYESTAAAQGWVSGDTRSAGTLDWTTDGLVLSTPDTAAKVQLVRPTAIELDAITELSYATSVISSGSVDAQRAAINVVIDANGPAEGGFATLVYEPVYNAGSLDAVQAGEAIWWSTREIPGVPTSFDSYVSLADISAANPDATVSSIIIN